MHFFARQDEVPGSLSIVAAAAVAVIILLILHLKKLRDAKYQRFHRALEERYSAEEIESMTYSNEGTSAILKRDEGGFFEIRLDSGEDIVETPIHVLRRD